MRQTSTLPRTTKMCNSGCLRTTKMALTRRQFRRTRPRMSPTWTRWWMHTAPRMRCTAPISIKGMRAVHSGALRGRVISRRGSRLSLAIIQGLDRISCRVDLDHQSWQVRRLAPWARNAVSLSLSSILTPKAIICFLCRDPKENSIAMWKPMNSHRRFILIPAMLTLGGKVKGGCIWIR